MKCGYENQADYNAAKNIGLRYLRRNQTGSGGGAPVGVRLNSAGPWSRGPRERALRARERTAGR
nr:hypothetical protein [Halodesulfurarchaeum formicicum]